VDFPVDKFWRIVQDHWSLTRQLTVDSACVTILSAACRVQSGTNNVSPRIGLAWSPSPKMVFRAGYGISSTQVCSRNLTRAIDKKNGSQAFEQVADGKRSSSLCSPQGGHLERPASGTAHPLCSRPEDGNSLQPAKLVLARNTCSQRI